MKKIIMFLLLFLVTGCGVDYNLVITNKQEVKEKIIVTVTKEVMLDKFSTEEEYLDYYSNIYSMNEGYEDFKIKTKKGNKSSQFIVTNSYDNLHQYIDSFSYMSMFNDASIETIGKYTTFTTTANEYLKQSTSDEYIDDDFAYSNFTISIKFYNEVISSNADVVDKKNNIYTWHVTKENPKEYITFKIGSKVRYGVMIKDVVERNLYTILVVGGISLVIICGGAYIVIKSRNNNRI